MAFEVDDYDLGSQISNYEDLNNIKEAFKKMFIEQIRYIQTQCILNSVQESQRSCRLPSDLSYKIKSIYLKADIESGVYRLMENDNDSALNILGVHSGVFSDSLSKLTYTEKHVLCSNITNNLSLTSSRFMKKLKIITNDKILKLLNESIADVSSLNVGKINVFNYYNQFIADVDTYNDEYSKTKKLLIKFVDFKRVWSNKQHSEHLLCLNSNAEEVYLRAKLFKLKTEYLILSLNNNTFDALLLLHKKLNEREKESSFECSKLKSKLRCYDNLKDTEFPAIVKEYVKIQQSLSHLQWTLNELKGVK